jgi:PHD/YefM family antitoxin component YafN of YafNO toxin-antitoxin module
MSAVGDTQTKRRSPEIVLRDGRPAAVILDIDEYQDMLERLEDLDDLEILREMREKPLGDYRIIYEIDDATRSVRIFRVRHRREAYQ